MNFQPLRAPAFNDWRPSAPIFEHADAALSSSLCSAVEIDGLLERMQTSHISPQGFYRLNPFGGVERIFLKVVPAECSENCLEVGRIVREIAGSGIVNVSELIPGFPRVFNDEFIILAYPYVDGRYAGNCEKDLFAIGQQLGNLHSVLKKTSVREEVRKKGLALAEGVAFGLKKLELGEVDAPKPVRDLAEKMKDDFLPLSVCALESGSDEFIQQIHGDVNYANILFPSCGGEPIILDFEDAVAAWLPRGADVAFAIERFVILANADDSDAQKLGEALLQGYRQKMPSPWEDQVELEEILRALALRALGRLAVNSLQNKTPDEDEWLKFVNLHQCAIQRSSLLAGLSGFGVN